MVRTSSEWGKFALWPEILPWRSRSIAPRYNRDLNQVVLHLWSKFCNPSLNGSQVITQKSKWLTHRLTDTQTQATTIPEGQNWPQVKMKVINVYHSNIWWPISQIPNIIPNQYHKLQSALNNNKHIALGSNKTLWTQDGKNYIMTVKTTVFIPSTTIWNTCGICKRIIHKEMWL